MPSGDPAPRGPGDDRRRSRGAIQLPGWRPLAALVAIGFLPTLLESATPAGDPAVVRNTPGLVAFWTFGEPPGEPRRSIGTPQVHPLAEVGGPIARVPCGPFSGYAAELNGRQYFRIPHAETGDLNIAGPDAQVSMFAVVRLVDLQQSRTIAGMWSEGRGAHDDSGTRQYALLLNMPTYGGPRQLTPHVSSEGGVTRRADGSAFPWCADYAATRSEVPEEQWCTLGFTYDGRYLRAYLNGVLEERSLDPEKDRRTDLYFTREGPGGSDRGMNPYYHGRGIFRYDPAQHAASKPGGGSDFTVGARYAVGSMLREATIGRFGGLAVFNRALTDVEMKALHDAANVAALDPTVLVYGATPAGIAAAVAAARSGELVVLAEPTARVGGLITSGLSHSDFHSFESLSGAFLDFSRRVEAHYAAHYGPASAQVRDSFRGTFGEPKANLRVFEGLLADHPQIMVRPSLRLASAEVAGETSARRITSATFVTAAGRRATLRARMFIDASYEGDLMAAAGVPWRAGREGRAEYGESLAPDHADGQLQGYNFRFIMTRNATNHVTPTAPSGYRREDFLDVLPVLTSGGIERAFTLGFAPGGVFKAQIPPLPNGKYDINDVSGGLIRLSLPGLNLGWPDATPETRAEILRVHLRDQVGLLYFLQNDAGVPAAFRDEARAWGWCRDEFPDTDHLPPQLYVREARRMVGLRVFTQHDSDHAPGDARAVLHRDAIAMGDYGNNCHGTAHDGPRFGGRHTGEFYHPVPPYQIPYGVIVPRDVDNLLVPVAASASHVGFCALRLEPIWMSLGQAAGHAAAQALTKGSSVQRVDVPTLQGRLHAEGSATIYVSDVPAGGPDFAAVQWWGTRGGLHGLAPRPKQPGQRGPNIHGQYYQANPGHAAEPDAVLDASLAARWLQLARDLGLPAATLPSADGRHTRRDFLQAAYQAAQRDP